mgnify:CR=1 FL=1
MNVSRIIKHLTMTHWQVNGAFPRAVLAAIENSIRLAEKTHGGQICFALEGALHTRSLFMGQSARERAIEVFSQLRVWDTQDNNGVLIYLLLADRDVEIVADRGIDPKVGKQGWEDICRHMEDAFRQRQYQQGVMSGIDAVAERLSRYFPASGVSHNELPDRPVIL